VVPPAYDYFMTKLEEIFKRVELRREVQKIPAEFMKYFMYERIK
jgi:hypothetical protein